MSAERGWIGEPQPELEWHAPGWLREKSSHYRRWRSDQPMNARIRGYAGRVRPKRRKPFAAEYVLLAELGLRRR